MKLALKQMEIDFLIASHIFFLILKIIVKSLEKLYIDVLIKLSKENLFQYFPKEKNKAEEGKKKRFEYFIETIAKEWKGIGQEILEYQLPIIYLM